MRDAKHDPESVIADSVLVVVAAPAEADAVRRGIRDGNAPNPTPDNPGDATWALERLSDGIDLIVTGVGKAQAAGGVAWAFDPARHRGVLSLGVGGALPSPDKPSIAQSVLASRSVFGDEGVRTPSGWTGIGAIGFPPGRARGGFGADGMPCSPAWAGPLGGVCTRTGVVAAVSSCSGTAEAARAIVDRTGACVENMEGAAVAAALSRLPVEPRPHFAEIRVISNTTGDRDAQVWDLAGALAALEATAGRAARALRDDPSWIGA
jgi:futalosine hydrolase